jgi:hypothetical protein
VPERIEHGEGGRTTADLAPDLRILARARVPSHHYARPVVLMVSGPFGVATAVPLGLHALLNAPIDGGGQSR